MSYAYAPNSNRLNQLHENVSFTAKTDDAESSAYAYNASGSMTNGDGIIVHSYDVRNLPLVVSKNGTTNRYRYNNLGQRIYKDSSAGKEHYLMNGMELIAVWKEGAGLQYWKTSYGRYQPTQGTYTSYYYINDHLGNVRVVLSETGQRVDATDYYAFGMALPQRRYDGGTKEQYSGKERDKETGWDYFGARYYNPSIGRFNGIDRFADKYPYFSPYQYAGNNPMSFIDVNGDSIGVRKEGNKVYVHFQGKVVDGTGKLTPEQIQDATTRMAKYYEEKMNQKVGAIEVIATIELTVATEDNPILASDHVVHISTDTDIFGANGFSFDGKDTQVGTTFHKSIMVNENLLGSSPCENCSNGLSQDGKPTLERTFIHEVGHSGGFGLTIGHESAKAIPGNLLRTSNDGGGVGLTRRQLNDAVRAFNAGKINRYYQGSDRNKSLNE